MNGIKYYALDENEEVPYEFVVTKNVNGEPEFCASFVNTNSLAYGNGVLLKLHQRNDELRAENAKLRELVKRMFDRVNYECRCCSIFCSDWDEDNECCVFTTLMRELGVDE